MIDTFDTSSATMPTNEGEIPRAPPKLRPSKSMVQRKRKQHLDQLRSLSPYAVIGFFMLLCTFYSVITTFTPTPTGALSADCNCSGVKQCICVREIVKALTPFQLFASSRLAYPPMPSIRSTFSCSCPYVTISKRTYSIQLPPSTFL